MSAIHTGRIDVRAVNGRLVVTGTSEDHPVTGWEAVGAVQDVRALIPAQRAGSTYEQQVLAAGRDDLADLRDSAEIPQLGAFVRDYIRAEQAAQEGSPR